MNWPILHVLAGGASAVFPANAPRAKNVGTSRPKWADLGPQEPPSRCVVLAQIIRKLQRFAESCRKLRFVVSLQPEVPAMTDLSRRLFFGASAATAATLAASSSTVAPIANAAEEPAVDVGSLGKTAHTKFAVNIEMWWKKLPFMDRIKKAAEFGYPAVEFWPFEGKDIPGIAKLAQELKIEISQFTAWGFEPGMNNPANEDKFIATIEKACEVAHTLNCRKMTVVAGNNQKGMSQEAMLAQVTKALKRAAPIVEKAKVMIILESMNGRVDHPGHCLYGSPDAVKICRDVNSPMVKINWDLYHMHISEGDLCGRMKDGIDQIGYLQLADHPGRNEPGTGEIFYPRVLREAIALGYKDYVGLELNPKTTELAAAIAVNKADQW